MCMYVSVWMYAWVCESRTTIQPPGLRVLTPIFQLFYCTLNPVNLLLFTLSPSSCSLCLYLSLSHTLMLIYSPSVSPTFSLHLPPAPYSTSLILTHSRSLVFLGFSLANRPPSLFITVPLHCVSTSADQDLFRLRQSLPLQGSDRHSGLGCVRVVPFNV